MYLALCAVQKGYRKGSEVIYLGKCWIDDFEKKRLEGLRIAFQRHAVTKLLHCPGRCFPVREEIGAVFVQSNAAVCLEFADDPHLDSSAVVFHNVVGA